MEHRNLNHQGYTLAAIDNLLERGTLVEWAPIITEIKENPTGEIAGKVRRIIDSRDIYGTSNLFRLLLEAAQPAEQPLIATKKTRKKQKGG